MGIHKVVRYSTSPETADENARLVAAVYAELATTAPADFAYATYRLDDGVTFVHVAEVGDVNPLMSSPAFAAFQADLGSRCVAPPAAADAGLVGSYRSR
jgi:hypothetical protein